MPMNRNVKANRVCDDWIVIFLQSVLFLLVAHNYIFPRFNFSNSLIVTEIINTSGFGYVSTGMVFKIESGLDRCSSSARGVNTPARMARFWV